MLLVSCLAISAASAADINNTNDAVLSDTSDLKLKAISEADLLSDNANNIEWSSIHVVSYAMVFCLQIIFR